jgi:lipopolysaccharide export system protein LptC
MAVESYARPETAESSGSGISRTRRSNEAPAPQTRSDAEFAAASRHSKRVRALKFGLPLAALFASGFFTAATFLSGAGGPAPSAAAVSMSDGRIVMANPKMEGFDADKRPYTMTADRAIQQSAASSVVDLEKIAADLPLGNAVTAKLTADGGVYDSASNKLDLKDNIRLLTSDGMQASLSKASINLSTNEMTSGAPVDIIRDGSRITADGMRITEGGKVIVFENHVRLIVEADKVKQASDASAEPGTQQE